MVCNLLLLGVEVLLQRDAELFPQRLELRQILVVLGLVLDLGLDTYGVMKVSKRFDLYAVHKPLPICDDV